MASLYFVVALVLCTSLLQGCPLLPKLAEAGTRISTQFVLRDQGVLYGDLMGVLGDSVIVQDAHFPRFTSLNYEDLRMVEILKPGSPVVKDLGGALGGAGVGTLLGFGLAKLIVGEGPAHYRTERTVFFATLSIGAIGGGILGVVSALDREIVIEQKSDLLKLESLARFSTEEDLRNYRGY